MDATNMLRWYSTKRKVTAAQVEAERNQTDDSLLVCQKRLTAHTVPVLQQWFEDETGGVWKDIPVVEETVKAALSIEELMPTVAMAALHCGESPFEILNKTLHLTGYLPEEVRVLYQQGHQWLWDHHREYPWKIEEPNNGPQL